MLRKAGAFGRFEGSKNRAKRVRPTLIAAAAATLALTSGVSADSLAQPRDASLERRAADYIRFREDVAAVEAAPLNSAATIRDAHKRLSTHHSKALSSGWTAYAALVAADSPAFKKALEKEIEDGKFNGMKGRDALLARIAQEPGYVRGLDGASEAVNTVLSMAASDAARFSKLGEDYKKQAYAMQKTKWGMAKLPAPSSRLSEADAYGNSRGEASAPDLPGATENGVTQPKLASAGEAWSPEWGKGGGGRMNGENAAALMDRILNLAVRYSAGGTNEKLVETYSKNDRAEQCLHMASLTLRQCIAATRAPYEEAFCLGEHGMIDPGECVGWIASAGGS
jgi:hypothetical protein